MRDTSFPNFHLLLENWNFITDSKSSQMFSFKKQTPMVHFWANMYQMPKSKKLVLPICYFFPLKMVFPECRSSAPNSSNQAQDSSWDNHPTLIEQLKGAPPISSIWALDFVQCSAYVIKSFALRNSEAIGRSSVSSQVIQTVCILLSKSPTISIYRRILRGFSK